MLTSLPISLAGFITWTRANAKPVCSPHRFRNAIARQALAHGLLRSGSWELFIRAFATPQAHVLRAFGRCWFRISADIRAIESR